MSRHDRASGWVSAVLRDYGPEAWHDDERAVRRDAEFVVLDSEARRRHCALLRSLGATPGARRWAVAEVSQRGMDGASPEAIRAVMADPTALCDVAFNALTSAAWAEAVDRYRSTRDVPTRRQPPRPAAAEGPARRDVERWGPPTWVSRRVTAAAADSDGRGALAATAAAADPDGHEIEHVVVLGGHGLRTEAWGTLRLWRARGSGPDNSWWLMIRFPAVAAGPGGDPRGDVMADYRDRSLVVECPGLRDVLRRKVLLVTDDWGDLISDRYLLEGVDPHREGFAFTLGLEPGGATGRHG